MSAGVTTRTVAEPTGLTCFQSSFACDACPLMTPRFLLGPADVQRYVTNGSVSCRRCGANVDIREQSASFPLFGRPEGLFGLHTWRAVRQVPETAQPQVLLWDIGPELPYDGRIVYANITNQVSGPLDEGPSLMLWNQAPHAPWPTSFRFHIPPGGERAISLLVVVKPDSPSLPFPLEVALQGVDAFHRLQFGVATIMLAASIEATLRPRVEDLYASRGVRVPSDLGFSALLERGQLLFAPRLGPKLVGSLRELAKIGRNAAAHGHATTITREQVAGWMVDVAAIFEWANVAMPSASA